MAAICRTALPSHRASRRASNSKNPAEGSLAPNRSGRPQVALHVLCPQHHRHAAGKGGKSLRQSLKLLYMDHVEVLRREQPLYLVAYGRQRMPGDRRGHAVAPRAQQRGGGPDRWHRHETGDTPG